MSEKVKACILAGALLSITVNPLAFKVADMIGKWAGTRYPRWSEQFGQAAAACSECGTRADQGAQPKNASTSKRARSPSSWKPSLCSPRSTRMIRKSCCCSSCRSRPRPASASARRRKGRRHVFPGVWRRRGKCQGHSGSAHRRLLFRRDGAADRRSARGRRDRGRLLQFPGTVRSATSGCSCRVIRRCGPQYRRWRKNASR